MNRKQLILLSGVLLIIGALVAFVIYLISQNSKMQAEQDDVIAQRDSLELVKDQMALTDLASQVDKIEADFSQYEDQQVYLKNDSIVQKYNQARQRVESLMKELNAERKKGNLSAKELAASRAKIKQLEGEISTLRGIVRHYLEEIQRLGKENEGLRQEIQQVSARNEELSTQVASTSSENRQLSQTVQLAKKLNITALSLRAYNKKGKAENNVTKARQLGVSFSVSPNNTAAPGMKTFYIRIISPEGTLLGGGVSAAIDGTSVGCTSARTIEYANDEVPVTVYWDVNTTLTPGDYTVEVICDGYRLANRHFNLNK